MNLAKQKADLALAILDAKADAWAERVSLVRMIKDATSPMGLNRSAPDDVRAEFRHRMEVQIDAIVRQAYREGAYDAICALHDEAKA